MPSSEEDSYSMIFSSLKHPIRRKILRILSSEAQTFSDLQKQFNIESSHLTYHIDGLGNLLLKTEDGKYALSSLGEAAVSTMKNVEEPSPLHLSFERRSRISKKKIVGRTAAIALGIICIVLIAALGVVMINNLIVASDKDKQIASLYSQIADQNKTISSLHSQISQLNSNVTDLQNQIANQQRILNALLNTTVTIVTLDELAFNTSAFLNTAVVVEGKLYSLFSYNPEDVPPGNYRIFRSNETSVASPVSMWVSWHGNYTSFDFAKAIVVGVVRLESAHWPVRAGYVIEATRIVPM